LWVANLPFGCKTVVPCPEMPVFRLPGILGYGSKLRILCILKCVYIIIIIITIIIITIIIITIIITIIIITIIITTIIITTIIIMIIYIYRHPGRLEYGIFQKKH
jgi:hypothetical protein